MSLQNRPSSETTRDSGADSQSAFPLHGQGGRRRRCEKTQSPAFRSGVAVFSNAKRRTGDGAFSSAAPAVSLAEPGFARCSSGSRRGFSSLCRASDCRSGEAVRVSVFTGGDLLFSLLPRVPLRREGGPGGTDLPGCWKSRRNAGQEGSLGAEGGQGCDEARGRCAAPFSPAPPESAERCAGGGKSGRAAKALVAIPTDLFFFGKGVCQEAPCLSRLAITAGGGGGGNPPCAVRCGRQTFLEGLVRPRLPSCACRASGSSRTKTGFASCGPGSARRLSCLEFAERLRGGAARLSRAHAKGGLRSELQNPPQRPSLCDAPSAEIPSAHKRRRLRGRCSSQAISAFSLDGLLRVLECSRELLDGCEVCAEGKRGRSGILRGAEGGPAEAAHAELLARAETALQRGLGLSGEAFCFSNEEALANWKRLRLCLALFARSQVPCLQLLQGLSRSLTRDSTALLLRAVDAKTLAQIIGFLAELPPSPSGQGLSACALEKATAREDKRTRRPASLGSPLGRSGGRCLRELLCGVALQAWTRRATSSLSKNSWRVCFLPRRQRRLQRSSGAQAEAPFARSFFSETRNCLRQPRRARRLSFRQGFYASPRGVRGFFPGTPAYLSCRDFIGA